MPVRGLAGVLRDHVEHGWNVDDVAAAVRLFEIAGNRVLTAPDNPYGYLRHMLAITPIDQPPALMDRAQTAQLEMEQRARFRADLDGMRAAAVAAAATAAATDSPARAAAMDVAAGIGHRAIGRVAADRAAGEHARREIAAGQLAATGDQ